jgi:hypothetical protein
VPGARHCGALLIPCYFSFHTPRASVLEEKNRFASESVPTVRYFCPDVHDMWTGAFGRFVLIFVPSRSDVPVQRNGARRGRQCFSYGRVQKVKFQKPIFFQAFICDPQSYCDSDAHQDGQYFHGIRIFYFRLSPMAFAQKTLKNDVFKWCDAWLKSNSAAIRPPIFFQVAKTLFYTACI